MAFSRVKSETFSGEGWPRSPLEACCCCCWCRDGVARHPRYWRQKLHISLTEAQPRFRKFLDPPLLSNCKRNKSSLSSSTLRSSHSSCERREHFSFFNPGFRSSTWSASPMWRSTLTLLLFCFCWCIFQRIQSRSLLRVYNTKQLNRQAKRSILRYTYAFVNLKKARKIIGMLKSRYHDKPASLAESGRKPSSLVKSSLECFELSFSSFEEDFRLRAVTVFLALCISLHLEPFEHLPVVENSSHSRMCFLWHCQTKKRETTVLTVCPIRGKIIECRFSETEGICSQGDSSEIKVTDEFFETSLECSLPSTVSKNIIKMIGHHSRLRDVMGQSYLICACTRANHARYSSVQVIFCGSSKHSL